MFIRKIKLIVAGLLTASAVCGVSMTAALRLSSSAKGADVADLKSDEPGRAGADLPPAGPGKNRTSPIDDDKRQSPKVQEKPSERTPLDLLMPTKPLIALHPDEINLMGAWQITESIVGGEARDSGDKVVSIGPFGSMLIREQIPPKDPEPMTYRIDPRANPKTIDLIAGGKTQKGIYSLNGDYWLEICLSINWAVRPGVLASAKGSDTLLLRLHRKAGLAVETGWADAMFVDGRTCDLGLIKAKDKLTHRFVFKNNYDRAVRASGQHVLQASGASYHSAEWSKWPSDGINVSPAELGWVEPGQQGAIELEVFPQELRPDAVEATVKLQFIVKGIDMRLEKNAAGQLPMPGNPAPILGESWVTLKAKFKADVKKIIPQ
jgi:uncharacterized protein (TIGR03067 family)